MEQLTYFVFILLTVPRFLNSVSSLPMENDMPTSGEAPKRVLLILLDGFRWDYLDFPNLVGFPRIKNEGVQAEYMEALYPSESSPGYYAVATGLNGESHGMVLNYMYDSDHDRVFQMSPDASAKLSYWWNDAEPLWITTTRRNISTAMMLWPGSDTVIRNLTARFTEPYASIDGTKTFRTHLNKVLDMFVNDDIRYAQVYCELTDKIGHAEGPNAASIKSAVMELDGVMTELLNNITSKNLSNSLHFVIVSDHGMSATDSNSVVKIDLNSVLEPNDVLRVLDRGSHASIYPAPGKNEDEIVGKLKRLEGIDVYKKEEIPERLHFKHHRRIPPIYVIVKPGYFLLGLNDVRQIPRDGPTKVWNGFHGYDNEVKDMNAIFLAWGPSLKRGYLSPPIKITDPYNLLTHLLGTEPLPNNGTWSKMEAMLAASSSVTISTSLMICIALFNLLRIL